MTTNPGQPTTVQGNFASNVSSTPAVTANGTAGAMGVQASSDSGFGVFGRSASLIGVGGQSNNGTGVEGSSTGGTGVSGQSNSGIGVSGQSQTGLAGRFLGNVTVSGHLSSGAGTFVSSVRSTPAVTANGTTGATGLQVSSDSGIGIEATSQSAHGIFARSNGSGNGVGGGSDSGIGVAGSSTSGTGVRGESQSGLAGEFIGNVSITGNVGIGTTTPTAKLEVDGELSIKGVTSYNNGLFLTGSSTIGSGLSIANTDTGGKSFALFSSGSGSSAPAGSFNLYDDTASAYRLTIDSSGNVGIGTTAPHAKLDVSGGATEGLHIANTNQSPYALMINNTTFGSTDATGFGLWQGNTGTAVLTNNNNNAISIDSSGNVGVGTTTPTAKLEVAGDINVTGDVVLLGADCAEEFDISEAVDIEPGTVMVLDQDGRLQQSQRAYDKRVAGVISGAGNYKPGLILDRQQARDNRLPVALVGKVYCKVDAQYAPIEVGDLLTTSSTPGHAMKADDPFKAFGSVIGKALRPLEAGQGMIPILIALQ